MVSFFGLKVGGKKKKPDEKPIQEKQPQQGKHIDQNALGEGQFFGQNTNQHGVTNGSIRSVSRGDTSQPMRSASTPYANRDTHNMAVASMADLTTSGPVRSGSQASVILRPHASEANIRTRFGTTNGSSASLAGPAPGFGARFGANNGSSTSLAAPAPGFGARFGANNGSSTSLAGPGPGVGPRPGTSGGRVKPWVNPLDVHFARDDPSGPTTPKSPMVDSIHLPPTPTTDNGDAGSVFGEEVDDMVDAVMASVKKRELEEKNAKRREKELERERETARLDMERLERQKSTESTLTARGPASPHSPLGPQPKPFEELALRGPVFRGDTDLRPGSRNGPAQAPSWHQGPPPTGPPTQCLPQPPGQGPPRQGPLGPAGECRSGRPPRPAVNGPGPGPGPGPRPNPCGPQQFRAKGPSPGPPAQGAHSRPQGPPAQDNTEKVFRPYRPPPLQGSGPLANMAGALRSPSPPQGTSGANGYRSQGPALRSAAVRNPTPIEHHAAVFSSEPEAPGSRRGTPGPERQGLVPLISSLTSPSTVTSPTGSIRRLSIDDESGEQFTRPIIQNVIAKRDTLNSKTSNAPRQHSLSMRIEELEKTLLSAQHAHPVPKLPAPEDNRISTTSSVYSDGIKSSDDDDDDDGPILSIHPAPLRIMSPPVPANGPGPAISNTMSPPAPMPAAISRPQSPMRGPPRRGPLPRRPGLEEYGVPSKVVNSRGGTPTPASRSGSTDNYSSHSSPPSRTNTPQLRQPNVRRDLSQPSPASTVDTLERGRPNPVVDTGFKFDFGPGPGPGVIGPPTPDSTTWSLASPAGDMGSALPAPTSDSSQVQVRSESSAKFTRTNVPAPLNLKFNFSPDAPSRDPTLGSPGGLWTPPIRSSPAAGATMDGRPSTSGGPGGPTSGGGLAASPSFLSKFPDLSGHGDDDPAAFMGIGMARGPSIRDVRRPKTSGGRKPKAGTGDSYGTGFI